jgi:FAD:protein FMN transferase
MRITVVLWVTLVCTAPDARGETLQIRGVAQGTTYHIKIASPPEAFDVERAKADVEKVLAEIDQQMSTYRPDSEISRFNRAPAGEWFEVSRAVRNVVAISREISEKTGGAQDITVGPLVRLWQFGPQDGGSKKTAREFKPPTDEQIQDARKRVGYQKLDFRLDRPMLRKQVDGLEVDLSSIAPGYTIDRLADVLRKYGVRNFMVELGGELRAAGKRSDGTPWRVAIERPLINKREMETAVPLVDGAMATAGGSRHFFEYEGKRYSHVIDPATGRPVANALSSVTVVDAYCVYADGWDTPLLVLGPERGMQCAEKNGVAAMFISQGEKGDEVRTTSAWRKRFDGK